MTSARQQLPFVPPVEGCEIERIHHWGPFITRVDMRLPDGKPWVWTSRRHRYLGAVRALPEEARSAYGSMDWWIKVGILARIGWWTAALFMIGSTCFALSSAAGLLPGLFGDFARNAAAINSVFFVGSLFFTSAAYLQFLAAVNAHRVSALAHRKRPDQPFRWFDWRPAEIGWLSAFTQFVGTLLFNLNTFDVLLPGLGWQQEEILIWAPDVLGSVCFLIASTLAGLEYGGGRWVWRPADVSWWVVNINMLGSVAFGISAVYAFVLPGSGELLSVWAVNLWTLVGAVCFLVGALLLLPELRRNLRALVATIPD